MSRCCEDTLSPLRLVGVLVPGEAGTIVFGYSSGIGNGDMVCGVVLPFIDRLGVDIRTSVGEAHFVHTIFPFCCRRCSRQIHPLHFVHFWNICSTSRLSQTAQFRYRRFGGRTRLSS